MSEAINRLVAEKVMGLVWYESATEHGWKFPSGSWVMDDERTPAYSTDIAAAWEVVEKMRDSSYRIEVAYHPDRGVSKTWKSRGKTFIGTPELNHSPRPYYCATIMGKSKQYEQCWEGMFTGTGDAAPLAICLAALKAAGVPDAEITKAQQGGGNGTPQA